MQAFGISAFVLSIIGIFVPVIGYFMAGLSGLLAFFSAGKGTTLGLSAVIINIVNILFLSPSLILAASDKHAINPTHQTQAKIIFATLLLIQIIALMIFAIKQLFFKK
ncbi:hypothetical protein [Beggiatoa leptomitoformis]|uniref:Uncharacterized protein n=1 Tax=Beggiatoa leptomitoformis TaxID=288004 RepID=A0A2N9YHR5_9GAMM|nr:hypothetical protein [Beggiatoa leptomitoformis]ALG67712.1 hypothetical protein AL038_08310 [Beggiatoa leptomitoformis]AUI70050.1 hypothetical protein BLE401_15995 [Beggiatoa leptomitoformis]